MERLSTRHGLTLIETVIAVSLVAVVATIVMGMLSQSHKLQEASASRRSAIQMAEEGLAAAQNIRNESFALLQDGQYGLDASAHLWSLSATSDERAGFTRTLNVSTVDPNTKRVVVTIDWSFPTAQSFQLGQDFTNWRDVVVVGSWLNPQLAAQLDDTGTANAIKVQTLGNYAFVIRVGNTDNLSIIDISDSINPIVIGRASLSGTLRDIYVLGNYAYVTSSSNNDELQIIDITNPASPAFVGSLDLPGGADANGIYVVDTIAHITRNSSNSDEYVLVNIANPATPVIVGSIDIGSAVHEVVEQGSYAYLMTDDNAAEVQAINITNPALPTIASTLDLTSNDNTLTGSILDGRLFVGQGSSVHEVSIANPLNISLVRSVVAGGEVHDISLDAYQNTYFFAVTNNSTAEFEVFTMANNTLSLGVSVDIAGNVAAEGVAYNASLDSVVIASDINTAEVTLYTQ